MDIESRRFVFVTGKGGVGKSTVSAALAQMLVSRGRRVLVATNDPKERLSTLLGTGPLGSDVVEFRPNLWAVNIQPQPSLDEYGGMVLHNRLLHRAVFGNRYVQNFFAAVPGLYQWAILGKAWFHSTETLADGSPRFHSVIFDAPATGHALEMLWVPKVVTEVARSGRLHRDASRAWAMLQDPAHSALCLVSLAEEVPTAETLDLAQTLQEDLALPLAGVIVNSVLRSLLSAAECDQLTRLPRSSSVPVQAVLRRAAREGTQRRCMRRLESIVPGACVSLPELLEGAGSADSTERLAAHLALALSHESVSR